MKTHIFLRSESLCSWPVTQEGNWFQANLINANENEDKHLQDSRTYGSDDGDGEGEGSGEVPDEQRRVARRLDGLEASVLTRRAHNRLEQRVQLLRIHARVVVCDTELVLESFGRDRPLNLLHPLEAEPTAHMSQDTNKNSDCTHPGSCRK